MKEASPSESKRFSLSSSSLGLFTAAFGWVSKQQNASTPVEGGSPHNADSISRFSVPRVPRAGLHGHGLGAIVCLSESCGILE